LKAIALGVKLRSSRKSSYKKENGEEQIIIAYWGGNQVTLTITKK
jgi:hypothetical protein|tara:strand:+ start:380 stop:514 length:135 start_codon:yes stop_codon:yes gene_type:complete